MGAETSAEDSAAWSSRWCSGRRSRPAQSNPQTLRVAVGASLRILYWTVTPVRRPLRPGASFAAVCPPDFRTPTSEIVSSRRLSQWRTAFVISTSAPSTENFTCLTSFSHRPPSLLIVHAWIGGLDRLLAEHEPLVSSSGASYSAHEDDGRDHEKGHQSEDLDLHFCFPSDPRSGQGSVSAHRLHRFRGSGAAKGSTIICSRKSQNARANAYPARPRTANTMEWFTPNTHWPCLMSGASRARPARLGARPARLGARPARLGARPAQLGARRV